MASAKMPSGCGYECGLPGAPFSFELTISFVREAEDRRGLKKLINPKKLSHHTWIGLQIFFGPIDQFIYQFIGKIGPLFK